MTVAAYVERVRAALGDLPPRTREELLEDLPEHLAEVMASSDQPLETLVGPPEAYAAELRATAAVETPRRPDVVRQLRDRLRVADTKIGPLLGYSTVSAFWRLLRPAWWIVRAYLAAMVLVFLLSGGYPGIDGLFPRLGGNTVVGIVLLVAFVVASVRLGQRQERLSAAPRVAVGAVSVALALAGLVGFLEADSRWEWARYGPQTVSYDQYSHVEDVFVYDREGRLLEGVTLVDQAGMPIRLGNVDSLCGNQRDPHSYPYCARRAPGPPPRVQIIVPSPTPSPSATG